MPPSNLPQWCSAEMLRALPLDSATCLGFEIRAGASRLSRQALKDLENHFPRQSGAAAKDRETRLAELDSAVVELDRARAELELQRAALRADAEND